MFNKGLIKKLAAVVISAVTLFSVSGLSSAYVSAADTNHFKFADIDLVVDVPKELICFTRTTTNNNSYLEKLGVDEAAVLTNNMIANKIYLEAVPEDVNYEVVIYGNTASNSLSSFKIHLIHYIKNMLPPSHLSTMIILKRNCLIPALSQSMIFHIL